MFTSCEMSLGLDNDTPTFLESSGPAPTPDELRAIEDDNAWFAAHSDREFRVREELHGEFSDGTVDPRGRVLVRTVLRLPAGQISRAHAQFLPIAIDDTSTDAGCRAIWQRLTAQNPWFNEKGIERLRQGMLADMARAQQGQRCANSGLRRSKQKGGRHV